MILGYTYRRFTGNSENEGLEKALDTSHDTVVFFRIKACSAKKSTRSY